MNNLLNFLIIRMNFFKVSDKAGISRASAFKANTLVTKDINRDRHYVEIYKYQQYFNHISWW
jgi:hypothetical protein